MHNEFSGVHETLIFTGINILYPIILPDSKRSVQTF